MMNKKKCPKCREEKGLPDFSKDISKKGGFGTYCYNCDRELETLKRERIKKNNLKNMKVCSKCKKMKNRSLFHKDKSTPDGLSYLCVDCTKKKNQDVYKRRKARMEAERKAEAEYRRLNNFRTRLDNLGLLLDRNKAHEAYEALEWLLYSEGAPIV